MVHRLLVVIGTTLGMLIADVPAVFVGNKFADKNSHETGTQHRRWHFRDYGVVDAVEG